MINALGILDPDLDKMGVSGDVYRVPYSALRRSLRKLLAHHNVIASPSDSDKELVEDLFKLLDGELPKETA